MTGGDERPEAAQAPPGLALTRGWRRRQQLLLLMLTAHTGGHAAETLPRHIVTTVLTPDYSMLRRKRAVTYLVAMPTTTPLSPHTDNTLTTYT